MSESELGVLALWPGVNLMAEHLLNSKSLIAVCLFGWVKNWTVDVCFEACLYGECVSGAVESSPMHDSYRY